MNGVRLAGLIGVAALVLSVGGCQRCGCEVAVTDEGSAMFSDAVVKDLQVSVRNGEQDEKLVVSLNPHFASVPVMGEKHFEVTQKIHAQISKSPDPSKAEEMDDYEVIVPLAKGAKLKMIAVPGGEFMMGSPDGEVGRDEDEGPQRRVKIDPMWVCEIEVPWAVYRAFYENGDPRNKDGSLKVVNPDTPLTKLITQPTPQYNDMFVNGDFESSDEFPAMDMTNHAANKFCEWLSAQTGHFYRLPTEAEWEYAARGGATTAYHWGDDPSKASDYAVFSENSNYTYQKVKQRKPNGYGLYDMAGNVSEWVLDQYTVDHLRNHKDGDSYQWVVPSKRYPRVYRGGNWESDVTGLRNAGREASSKKLKYQDPQVPKSIWYHTDGQTIGFRIVRPMATPSAEVMHRFWNTDEWSDKLNGEDL